MRNTVLLLFLFCSSVLFADKVNYKDTYNLKRAVEAIQNNDTESAYKYLNQELEEHPDNGYAQVWLAYLRNEDSDYGLALSACNAAVKKLPSKDKDFMAFAYTKRGEVWLNLEDTAMAVKDYTEALKYTPEDMDIYRDRAQIYFEQEKYDLADQDYRKMISIDQGDVVGYVGLGRNAHERKDYDAAIKQYNYVVKLAPDYPDVYRFRSYTYAELKKYNEAIDDAIKSCSLDVTWDAFNQIVELSDSAFVQTATKLNVQKIRDSKVGVWPLLLGYIYERTDKYAEAIPYFKENFALSPTGAVASRLSNCYDELGNYTKALDYCEQAISLDSTEIGYIFNKANLLDELGRTAEAIKVMDKCVEANPEVEASYFRRSQLKYYTGDIDGAVEDLTICVALNPELEPAYLTRGKFYLQKGDREKARQDFEKAIEIDTASDDSLSEDGSNWSFYAYYYLGDNVKAIEMLNKTLEDESAGNCYDAACLYSLMGDKEKAMNYLRKSLEKGYKNFFHIRRDTDLDNIRSEKEFAPLIQEYEQKLQEQNADEEGDSAVYEQQTEEVPFTKDGGVCKVKCHINNLPLHFIFDTGASDVSISSVEATFMLKNDYLSATDIMGKQNYITADGNISEGTVVNLKDVKLGSLHLQNVRASVVRNQAAPLLLGQSVLSRLGKIEIDNSAKVLRITYRKKVN